MSETKLVLDAQMATFILSILGIFAYVYRLANRVGHWEEKLKNTAEFVTDMRRIFIANSLLDAEHKGILRASSPLKPNPEIIAAFGNFGREIKDFYDSNGLSKETNDIVIFKIWRNFESDLVSLAKRTGINLSDVLASALYLCRGE